MEFTAEQRQFLLNAARAVIRANLGDATALATALCGPEPDAALCQPAGCFVSLHQRPNHRLRGCVGRLDAHGPLIDVVRQTAAAVLDDPRFAMQRITLEELGQLDIDISVLSPLRAAPTPLDFDPQNEGIYLIFGDRAGCFLPQVARETGWNRQQLLDRLCTEKLGVPASKRRQGQARLKVF